MDKKEVSQAKVEKQQKTVSRYLITHRHNPQVTVKEPVKPVLKKTDVRITRAKRLLEQIEVYKQQVLDAENELEIHGAVDLFDEAKDAADWVEMQAGVSRKMATHLSNCADAAEVAAEKYCLEAERLQKEAREQIRLAADMRHNARGFEATAVKILNASNSNGAHADLKAAEKNLNAVRHRLRRKAREASNKVDKYKNKLAALMEEIGPLLDTLDPEIGG